MINFAITCMVYAAFLIIAIKRVMIYLHVLQQEDYNTSRLQKWILQNKAFDKKITFSMIVLSIVWQFIPHFFMGFLIFIAMIITSFLERDPRRNQKKKFVLTDRAMRIFVPAVIFTLLLGAWCFSVNYPYSMYAWPWIISIQLLPFTVILANGMMGPFENIIQKLYWNEAYQKIQQLQPTIIGITGSFGKTSVKHILGHILGTQAPTLMTPGSVNTPMGITRIIREQLTEDYKFFIVEMGAYGTGSIANLCELTPPDHAIITSIGHAHYERFKSLENVAQAKYELAQAVLKKEKGTIVAHERTLKFPYPRSIRMDNKSRFIVCGEPPEIDPHKRTDTNYLEKDDFHIFEIIQTAKGITIKCGSQAEPKVYNVPIYGLHHGHNIAMCIAMAQSLGIMPADIRKALDSMPQIPHRLEVKPHPDGYTIIDDSYNSNPVGFRSALELLHNLAKGGKRKIIITPGMVELGIAHDEAHKQVGAMCSQICDVIIAVQPKRIPSFVEEIKSGSKLLVEVDSFEEATEWMNKNATDNDVVLIENDLPDMYEFIPKM